MKRLISLAVAVMLITLLGVCRSRAYDEYNLTDLAACSSVKSDSNGKGGSNDNHNSSKSDIQPNNSEYLFSDGIVYGIYSGETVADFKNKTSAENVYKADGTLAKSGKLKTGFTAVIDSKTYVIAVCGDVTGEGNVNSKDVTLLQKYLCDNAELDGAYLKAADFNLDGKVDNRDLVLISRQKN